MTPIQHTILYRYAGGESIQEICKEIAVPYAEVRRWLSLSEKYHTPPPSEEELLPSPNGEGPGVRFREFREEYLSIQKNSIPILIDELRTEAKDLLNHTITIKGIEKIAPSYWQNYKAGIATIKLLQSFFKTRLPLHLTTETRQPSASYLSPEEISASSVPTSDWDETFNASTNIYLLTEGKNPQSQFRNPQSPTRIPRLDLDLTPEEAEEYLGSPILLDENYFQHHPEHRKYAKWIDEPTTETLTLENPQSAKPQHLSPEQREESEIVNRKSEIPQSEIINLKSEMIPHPSIGFYLSNGKFVLFDTKENHERFPDYFPKSDSS